MNAYVELAEKEYQARGRFQCAEDDAEEFRKRARDLEDACFVVEENGHVAIRKDVALRIKYFNKHYPEYRRNAGSGVFVRGTHRARRGRPLLKLS